ncbi:hypothetical protein TRAPUB_13653 [Trametes pubescens]|uniref:F-box domain-containing protein n=1 Tax=Trametes pubescens TaxID=154538 RepID=A0A1M2VQT0_TRAPU|nr:hypothetical protein TRAPUB_13653 [Trametes pubescens]
MSALQRLPPEALTMICSLLLPPDRAEDYGYTYTGLAALLALAATSRLFHEHALNVIWNTLPGYSMLVYTLPRDAWTAKVTRLDRTWSGPITELSIVRPLEETDLTRLKHYAWRVKHVMRPMDQSYFPKRARNHQALPCVLKSLADVFRQMPGDRMLPNLLTLRLDSLDKSNSAEQEVFYRSVDVLYGPKLRDFLSATCRAPRDAYDVSLAKLAEISAGLVSLNLYQMPWNSRHATSASRTICNLYGLRYVRTGSIPINPEAFLHLAKLPSLRSLACTMALDRDQEFLAMFENVGDKGYFPRLLELSLSHPSSFALPTVMLQAASSSRLYSVSVTVHEGTVSSQAVKDIFTLLASRKGKSRLRSVEVEVGILGRGDAVAFDTIEPLLVLSALTSVIVKGFDHYAIDDLALLAMAASWPRIRRLELGPEKLADAPKALATLAGLIPFAQHCPDLRSLALRLNTDTRRISNVFHTFRPGLGKEQRRLIMLKVGRSPIEDPVAVAAFLSDLFPKLCNIENDFAFEEDAWEDFEGTEDERERILADAVHRDRWGKVDWDYLPRFVHIRKQERKWGRKMGLKPLPSLDILGLPIQFLRFITSPYIADLHIMTTDSVPRHKIRPLLSAIAAHPSHNTIHTLCVDVYNMVRSDGRTDVAPSSICAKTLALFWGLSWIHDLALPVRRGRLAAEDWLDLGPAHAPVLGYATTLEHTRAGRPGRRLSGQ